MATSPLLPSTPPPFRWSRLLVWAFVIGLLALLGVGVIRAQQGQVAQGQKAPDFKITGFPGTPLAGNVFSLTEGQGQIILVNFWASWCLPCRDEAHDLETAWQKYKGQGVMFVGMDWADTEKEAVAFVNEFGVTYLNGPDLGTRAGQAYRIRGVPETYLINRHGILAWVKIGPTTLAELQGMIESRLSER